MSETTARPAPPVPTPRKKPVEHDQQAKAMIRAAITARGASYETLAHKLQEMGVEITPRGLENKISRGGFPAAFMLQCLDALGVSLEAKTKTK